jgi:hypothetical protein
MLMEHRPCGVWDAATNFHSHNPPRSALPTASWAFVVQIAAGRIPLDATAPKPGLAVVAVHVRRCSGEGRVGEGGTNHYAGRRSQPTARPLPQRNLAIEKSRHIQRPQYEATEGAPSDGSRGGIRHGEKLAGEEATRP